MVTTGMLDDETLLSVLAGEVSLFMDAFARCDPVDPVPGLRWDAQTVAKHTGSVHRWAADIVARRLTSNETGGSAAFWPGSGEGRLAAWLEQGAGVLVATLRTAPPDLRCFTFIPDVAPRSFWIRRQAHETAIHRADLEAAAGGPVTPADAAFAQDGLGEVVGAFATEPGFASSRPGRLLLDASDGPGWMVTFGGERNIVASGVIDDRHADAVVRGTSDELYRWAWNRPADVALSGDAEVLGSWSAVRVR